MARMKNATNSEEAISGHLGAHDARADGSRVEADADFQLVVGLVPDLEALHRIHNADRHARDFTCVQIPVANRQSAHHHVGVTYSDRRTIENYCINANVKVTNKQHYSNEMIAKSPKNKQIKKGTRNLII